MSDKKGCFVGFDTSNYTTSVAVCDTDGKIIANLKAPLPVKGGERGLRQSEAVFAHVKNLPALTDKLAEVLRDYSPLAVGVSATPRDLPDSYMPCFLCGQAAAHTFAAAENLPIVETAHQNGHIMAAMYSCGMTDYLMERDFVAFHVSGGTTEALLVHPRADKCGFDVELVGETLDINAGQAIDRIGVMLGLSFPCGRELEALAAEYKGKQDKRKISVNNGKCSLSGLENMAKKLYEDSKDKNAVAAFAFDFICRTLLEMCRQITDKYGKMPVLFAGGVMSNKLMRKELLSHFEAYFAEPEFSADNGAGVALLCRFNMLKKGEEKL